MIHISVLTIGKTKERWLEEAITEYVERLHGVMTFSFHFLKHDEQLIDEAEKSKGVFCLDPRGVEWTSEEWTKHIEKKWVEAGSHLTFVIGGADGLPQLMREKYPLISFSKMTFTHQMTRLILVEQLYRAQEILRGSPYHK